MHAIDADSGSNAIVTYAFDNSTSNLIVNRFAVNPRTGVVTTTRDLRDIGKMGVIIVFTDHFTCCNHKNGT